MPPSDRDWETFNNLEIYEGTFLTNNYTYSSRNPNQRIILPNSGIDLDTLVVKVRPSIQSSVSIKYERHDNLFDNDTGRVINGKSNIYFIQEAPGEQYELIFGDGIRIVTGKQVIMSLIFN